MFSGMGLSFPLPAARAARATRAKGPRKACSFPYAVAGALVGLGLAPWEAAQARSFDLGVRTGGYTGAITVVGAWNSCASACRTRLSAGYTPEAIAGTHSIDLSATFGWAPAFARTDLGKQGNTEVGAVLSFGAIYNPARRLFVVVPDRYPSGYYPPTGLHGLVTGGVEILWDVGPAFAARHGATFELVAHQIPALAWLRDSDAIPLSRAFSYAVGYVRRFSVGG